MSLFSKPKAVLWPKSSSLDLYLDRSENNIFSQEIDLWHPLTAAEAQSFDLFLSQNQVAAATILVPDDVVFTKSFTYDSEITTIDKTEIISLAESFVHFKIDPNYLDYQLIPAAGKTIILAHIFDRSKIEALKVNLGLIHLKSFSFESVSQAISKVISKKFAQEYFLLYPLNSNEFTLLLSRKDTVYLTANLKGSSLDVQKIINYSNLYFPNPTTKFYLPADQAVEINATSELDKTPYNSAQIAQEFKKAPNLPLPVLGLFITSEAIPAIINTNSAKPAHTSSNPLKTMEKNKNITPFIIVFLVTAVVASAIIYFVLTKNNTPQTDSSLPDTSNTPTEAPIPTDIPTPTVTIADVSKTLKIQVLNATEINGQAAVLKEQLAKLGFTSITVGNAKEAATANQIQLKSTQASASAYFQNNLPSFASAEVTTDLKANSTYDAVFIIGTDLSSGTTVSIAPSKTITKTATPTIAE